MSVLIRPAVPEDVWLRDRGRYRTGRTVDGRVTVNMSCPRCGGVSSLSAHHIDAQGNVTPSVICTYDVGHAQLTRIGAVDVKCDFHEYIRLDAWPGDAVKGEHAA